MGNQNNYKKIDWNNAEDEALNLCEYSEDIVAIIMDLQSKNYHKAIEDTENFLKELKREYA